MIYSMPAMHFDIIFDTSNNNNTKKKIGLHICAASVVQGKAVGDCLYISNKYEES